MSNVLNEQLQDGEKAKRDQRIEENTGLVWSVVKRFLNRGYEQQELFQVGCIGLIKAVDNFKPEYHLAFSSYAVPFIMGEIKRFLRDDRLVRVSRSVKLKGWSIWKTQQVLMERLGREPTVEEVAKELKLSKEEVIFAIEANRGVVSIDQIKEGEDSQTNALIERITGKIGGVGAVSNEVFRDEEKELVVDQMLIKSLLEKLEEREEKLIVLRYFREKKQVEVAKELGISQVQVSRLEKRILQKMRNEII